MPAADAYGGFLPVPPQQLFPSGGYYLHTLWAAESVGPFFRPSGGAAIDVAYLSAL